MTTAADPARQPAIPGPPSHIFSSHIPAARNNPLDFYLRNREQYGDIVRFRSLGSRFWILISHPAHIEHVLRHNQRNYRKGRSRTTMQLLTGQGLLTSEGSFWLRQRRLMQPAFDRQHLAALATMMGEAAETLVARWRSPARSGQPLDILAEMMRLTLQIVSTALLSTDISAAAESVGRAALRLSTSTIGRCTPSRSRSASRRRVTCGSVAP